MRDDRLFRVLRPSLALVALAAALMLLGLALIGPAEAAESPTPKATKPAKAHTAKPTPSPSDSGAIILRRGSEVRFGRDVVVPAGSTFPSVVVFGGDVRVDGSVTDSVVAFGGNVRINGTVGLTVVAFGGDVQLGPHSAVGTDLDSANANSPDAAVVLFGGDLVKAPGAQVDGEVQDLSGLQLGGVVDWVRHGALLSPFLRPSFFGWIVQTAFFLVLALVVAALMPKQLVAVQAHLSRRPWASLGWGALAFFVVVPVVILALAITIIGLVLAVPLALFFVPLTYFFVTTAVAAFVAKRVLAGFGRKESLMLSVVVGVVGTTVLSRIPAIGLLLLVVMMVMGTGAALLSFGEWRRRRREAAAAQAAAAAAYVAAYPAPAPGGGQAVITPIVQTSPAQQAPVPTATYPQQAPQQWAEPQPAPQQWAQQPQPQQAPQQWAEPQPAPQPDPAQPQGWTQSQVEPPAPAGPEPPAAPGSPAPPGPGQPADETARREGGEQPPEAPE